MCLPEPAGWKCPGLVSVGQGARGADPGRRCSVGPVLAERLGSAWGGPARADCQVVHFCGLVLGPGGLGGRCRSDRARGAYLSARIVESFSALTTLEGWCTRGELTGVAECGPESRLMIAGLSLEVPHFGTHAYALAVTSRLGLGFSGLVF
ncbi:hypothetical protein NDU88_003613 [Pleurodeles waltl]|uniref:Uncharacterized protein n=1 Tax=Pleurodeles waltl TaxID=8319 RepID=A0AAV7PD61_PLEWA|nr:hypothetical protein NDU88_003613 [Pleurodeles waltl]